jgi:CTP:molybdopterin cytidylyltransferase MocA
MPRYPETRFAALVLATGGVPGQGDPLAVARWSEATLLEEVVDGITDWPVDAVVVVLGQGAEDVLEVCDLADATIVIDTDWVEGATSSLRIGLDVLTRDGLAEAAVILPLDQPEVDEDAVERLVTAFPAHGAPAVVPKYRYAWGWPVIVGASLWPRVMSLADDETLERLLLSHPAWVHEVVLDSPPPRRIQTLDDLTELRRRR